MFVAVRDLRQARGRFALMGSVIVLITLLIALLSGLTAGLGAQNTSAVDELPADRIAVTTPAAGEHPSFAASTVTAEQWGRWAAEPGVRRAEPLGITTTRALPAEGSGPTAAGTGVTLFGVRSGSTLLPPGTTVGPAEVVLSRAAADDLGLREGGTLRLAGTTVRVTGVGPDAWYSHTPVVWTDLDLWRAAAPPSTPSNGAGTQTATAVALDVAPGTDLADAEAATGTTSLSRSEARAAIGAFTSENGSLQLMRGFLFAISALVVGAFFTVWTVQRGADVAVLKALGASTAVLLRDALGQALVLLLAGTALGTGLALGVGALLTRSGAGVPFVLTATTVGLPALVLVVLGAAGSALAVRRITSVDPLTALGSIR
ncbi:ABC transporter permease [Kineococcus gynurae]|uniref:ABC transporter permease n=1 Tax=Kineococcus gynurae TaxID=452979 RepID=A0ABV5LU50_9ACTN